MNDVITIILLTLLAGMTMPFGALLGRIDKLYPGWLGSEWRHTIIAFGGGALISAIALVLVPEGSKELPVWLTACSFALGGLTFFSLDIYLSKHNSSSAQLVAMLSDFIPEAIALGAAFAYGSETGLILALLIALQNLPEGFNAYREISPHSHLPDYKLILVFVLMALLGPLAGLSGYFWLSQMSTLIAAMMLFASGGILYLVFQDIAPQAKLENAWAPSLGAVSGFLLGLLGNLLL